MSVYDGASVFPIFIDGVKGAAIGMAISYGVSRIAAMGENKATNGSPGESNSLEEGSMTPEEYEADLVKRGVKESAL